MMTKKKKTTVNKVGYIIVRPDDCAGNYTLGARVDSSANYEEAEAIPWKHLFQNVTELQCALNEINESYQADAANFPPKMIVYKVDLTPIEVEFVPSSLKINL